EILPDKQPQKLGCQGCQKATAAVVSPCASRAGQGVAMGDQTTVMATPAEVAARDGVTKQAVTKLVRRLVEEHGLPVARDARDRITRFSLAHYDHYRSQFASSEKVAAARGGDAAPDVPAGISAGSRPDSSTSRDEALR